jgi:soluble lytic murein transglycosylase-like protein
MTSTRARTLTTTLVTGLIATGMALTTSPAGAAPAGAAPATTSLPTTHTDFPGPRNLVRHVVRPGETAGGLAVKYHAWTAELISYNHLGSSGRLYAGQAITIPVVPESLRHSPDAKAPVRKPARTAKAAPAPKATKQTWRHADPSRAAVRSAIIRTAKAHGVDPRLALAVSWQESGWQMHHVSHADAIGAMQVLPGTGTWMSLYADRPLELTRLEDNVLAGVLLLDFLGDNTSSTRHQVAAYYQGLRAVRERGLYDDTQAYVANVFAIRDQIAHGWNPA